MGDQTMTAIVQCASVKFRQGTQPLLLRWETDRIAFASLYANLVQLASEVSMRKGVHLPLFWTF